VASSSRSFEPSKLKKSSFKNLMNTLQPLGGFKAAFGLSKESSSSSLASAAGSKRRMRILPDTLDEHEMLDTLKAASANITTVGVACSKDHSSTLVWILLPTAKFLVMMILRQLLFHYCNNNGPLLQTSLAEFAAVLFCSLLCSYLMSRGLWLWLSSPTQRQASMQLPSTPSTQTWQLLKTQPGTSYRTAQLCL
jgi:hypothetical protein